MIPVSYSVPSEHTAPLFAAAFAKGCGGTVATEHVPGRAWAGFGSRTTWPGLNQTRRAGLPWYYGDHAYFGRRVYFRITRDAFQTRGLGETDGKRLAALGVEVKPWRTSGDAILLCPPDHLWARLMSFDARAWQAEVSRKLKENSDRDVIVRKRHGAHVPLEQHLQRAYVVVTHSSNVAVDALVYGVPVIVTGDCAARSMGRADPVSVEYPLRPDDRERWAGVLADNQWTMDEIAAGAAWERLQ